MNQHLYDYLKHQACSVMPGRNCRERDDQRAHVIAAVQQYPAHHRNFIASTAWSMLGYGGGL